MADARTDPEQLRPYLDAGWQLIPLHRWDRRDGRGRERGKTPLHDNWTRRPYRSEDQTAHMEDGGNVGVRLTAAQLVIDVDPRNGGEGGLSRLLGDLGLDQSAWPRVETGSGGSHLYLSKPEDVAVVDRLETYPGVEFKTLGRQVVAAGSVHPSTGRPYRWDPLSPSLSDAPAAPDALLDVIARPKSETAPTGGGEHTAEEVAAMLSALDPTDFRDHDKWLTVMQACHHASGGSAKAEFVTWSAGDPDYADMSEEVGRRWDSLHADADGPRVTHRTLHRLLIEAGREDAIPRTPAAADFDDEAGSREIAFVSEPKPVAMRGLSVSKSGTAPDTIANAISAVARSGVGLAFDELKQRAVFTAPALPWDEAYGRTLDDNTARLLRHYLIERYQGNDFQPSRENVWEAAMTVAYEHKFNPVLDYLDGLEWDGTPRVGRLFPDYFDTDDDEYARAVSACFMVAAVRRQREPGCKFDTMPVLRSRAQGKGKSTGVQALFGADWSSDADLGNLGNKDAAMLLQGIWAQEFAELDGLRRADVTTLKAFCSRAVDRVRPPYGKGVMDMPRRCVFVGTVNEGGYLKDGTGNRRFWPLTVRGEVDVDAIRRDRDQLWAEAARMEADGASVVLPRRLWAMAAEHQADQTSEDPWADPILDFLERRANDAFDAELGIGDWADGGDLAGVKAPPEDRVHTAELFDALGIDVPRRSKDASQKLRSIMEGPAVGWEYSRGVRVGDRAAAGYRKPGR